MFGLSCVSSWEGVESSKRREGFISTLCEGWVNRIGGTEVPFSSLGREGNEKADVTVRVLVSMNVRQ